MASVAAAFADEQHGACLLISAERVILSVHPGVETTATAAQVPGVGRDRLAEVDDYAEDVVVVVAALRAAAVDGVWVELVTASLRRLERWIVVERGQRAEDGFIVVAV